MNFYDFIKPDIDKVESRIEELIPKEPEEVYGILPSFIRRGGKRIRPMLVLLCCSAVGGRKEDGIEPAALIEVFHNFTLIHDDICDDSKMRRGEPTLNVEYGVPISLNAGDALYTILWEGLASLKINGKTTEIQKMFSKAFRKVVEGQGIELNWYREKRFDLTEEEYFKMIGGKTAALMGLSCETGAFIGEGDQQTRESLRNFGEKIGLAFQIHDDLLNITGDFDKYKKEIGGDITEGKRTLMVLDTLKKAEEDEREKLTGILNSNSSKKEDIDFAVSLLKRYGSVDYAREKAEELVNDAVSSLEVLKDSEEKKALLSLSEYIVRREG